ncbi:hypothetical protein P4H14_16360 [Bacillus cereus]|uniref:hypothetical protein n=1 Tax=Bacillus thuringiensis TaxID=1428 RepID=UPI000B44F4E8|nr:hypothetical protein [Bacillus thuringiensis]MDA2525709.1 hypothetical protein [Bacillus cereus]MDA2561442.1 hypothetical protein [Bacillus cereus]MEB8656182.1 hypothetical protein [Bacillus cereus]MEB8720662.1 hypothetical protein [Bacillus cereus]MEB8989318.1 hypothetical protein [Bacillus cereus]
MKQSKEFLYWCEKLDEFNDDMNDVEELCIQYGKIIKPTRKTDRCIYDLYNSYSTYVKTTIFTKNTFSKEGLPIQDWCKKTGWDMKELLGELSFL